jgi:hypothetical protein
MNYVLGAMIIMVIGVAFVLIDDCAQSNYWNKKCKKCGLKPFHCINCKRFERILKKGG